MSLEYQMRQILAAMELVSHGATMRWNPSGGKSDNPDPTPPGESKPLHEHWRLKWHDCGGDELAQAKCVKEAQGALTTARKAAADRPAGETRDDLAKRIVKDGEGLSVTEAALTFRETETFVRRSRLSASRDAEYGKPYVEPVFEDRSERVLVLVSKGMSTRQIHQITGVHPTQVQRIKQRRAA